MDGEIQCWRVRNWNRHFENNRTRELKRMDWVPMPNKHDGDGFTELMDHANGMAHYGAWALIAQVAAKCDPRGTLLRDCRTLLRDGAASIKAHDFETLARVTRGSVKVFQEAIPRLIYIGWLEVVMFSPDGSSELSRTVVRDERQNPAGECGEVPMEWNGMERKGNIYKAPREAGLPATEKEAVEWAEMEMVPAQFAAEIYNQMEGVGWKDGSNRAVTNWRRYIKGRYSRPQEIKSSGLSKMSRPELLREAEQLRSDISCRTPEEAAPMRTRLNEVKKLLNE